jgi:hypothetical protein
VLQVLDPLEVRDHHASRVRHHVRDDDDALVGEDRVGGRRGRAVRPFDDQLAVDAIGVRLMDHAAESGRDQDVALGGEQLVR